MHFKAMKSLQIFLLAVIPAALSSIAMDVAESVQNASDREPRFSSTTQSEKTESNYNNHVTADVAQASANFFTDIGPPSFNSRNPVEYDSLFDSLPSLPYFPDFGEIFRIQRTTTPKPPFRFPDYVRDAFPERPPESPLKPLPDREEPESSVAGRRRPVRRLPRPASSGTKAKLVKQNHGDTKEKVKPGKNKTPTKAKDYPKIFRFTADRVNLADFDMRKKMNGNYIDLAKGDDLDSNKIQRNKFLILHGGVFRIERPANNGIYGDSSELVPVTEKLDSVGEFGARTTKGDGEQPFYRET